MAEQLRELEELSPSWNVEELPTCSTRLLSTPGVELTGELGWSDDHYVEAMSRLLGRALLGD